MKRYQTPQSLESAVRQSVEKHGLTFEKFVPKE
jgi:hypothetical protein